MNTTISAIDGGHSLPPEPDWASVYSDEFDIAAAHERWGTVARELQSANTLAVANGMQSVGWSSSMCSMSAPPST
jgi:hypothetical protein